MASWTEHDPGAGDLDGLEHRILRLQDHRDHASEMRRTMRQVTDRLRDDWAGVGYDAWAVRAHENAAAWSSLHHWADTEHDVLRRYVNAVESIKERAVPQKALLAVAEETLPTVTDPDDVDDHELAAATATRSLGALADERRDAEAALARGMNDVQTVGFHLSKSRVPDARHLHDMDAPSILALLGRLSPHDLETLLTWEPDLADQLRGADPDAVAQWWSTLDNPHTLVDLAPQVVGALDGVPPEARVAANRILATRQLTIDGVAYIGWGIANARLPNESRSTLREMERLEREMAYLRRVESGEVQLYLYDPDASRIIEMIGTPSPATTRVITYVPGTFTNLDSFSTNGIQQIAHYLQAPHASDTVAFVYKDGTFPGEEDDASPQNFARLVESNDLKTGLIAGKKLAKFEAGLRAAGLNDVDSTAIGHSWGLANVTSSEVYGARYDHVFSLSGAWAPRDWEPHPETTYTDLSYDDILQKGAGVINQVPPRHEPGFDSLPYFTGPHGMDPLALHNLVASTSSGNNKVLDALKKGIFG